MGCKISTHTAKPISFFMNEVPIRSAKTIPHAGMDGHLTSLNDAPALLVNALLLHEVVDTTAASDKTNSAFI